MTTLAVSETREAIDSGGRCSPWQAAPCNGALRVMQLGMGWFPEQPGGLDRYYYDLLRHLRAEGIESRGLLAGSDAAAIATSGQISSFAPANVSMVSRWRGVRKVVATELEHNSPAVIAAHFAAYTWPVLRTIRHTPLVVHFHGPWAEESRVEGSSPVAICLKRLVERGVYKRARRIIVLSRAFADVLVNTYGIARDRIEIIPGGVDVARFDRAETKHEARKLLGWPTDRPIVFAIRRLVSRMGLEDLIDAVADLRRAVPDALVLIAGKGRLASALQEQIDRNGLQDHVRLLGYLPDEQLPLAYRAADLSVAPSIEAEGFGLVVAESLSAGTPAMVTPVGGLPEVVRDLSDDLVLDPRRPLGESLAGGLTGDLPMPSSIKCREYACRFDWTVVTARIAAVYRAVAQPSVDAPTQSRKGA